MSAAIKRNLKFWMLVYVGFVVALTAANLGTDRESDLTDVSPGSLPAGITPEKSFFRPTVEPFRRNDI